MDHIPSFLFGTPDHCTYCGAPPSCYDHVIPISSYRDKPRTRRDDHHGVRTYACSRCNGLLGSKVFPTFRERVAYVNGKLVEKAQKYRRDASWSDEEIAALDDTLRSYVASRQLAQRAADANVQWADSAGFWAAVSTLYAIPQLDRESPKFVEWLSDYFSDFL